jgi:hypothetical protein
LVDDLPSTEIKTTDAQGDVRWDAVPSGEYLAWVEHESLGFFSTPIPVRSSGTEPAFVVAPEKHWVYLRVFDADDEPLVGAEVSLNLGNGLPEGEPKVTDDKGEVRWDGVPNDDYVAWVTHESTGFFSSPVTTRSLGSEPLFVMTSPAEEGLLLSLALTDDDGDPLKNHPYTLVFEGGEEPGETDDKGWLNEVLPSGLETADLHIDDEVFELQLDDLDDLDDDDDQNQLRACQARLVNLGYEPGPIDGLYGPKTKAGLLEFQEDEKLKKSGKLDDATREALLNRHGC